MRTMQKASSLPGRRLPALTGTHKDREDEQLITDEKPVRKHHASVKTVSDFHIFSPLSVHAQI